MKKQIALVILLVSIFSFSCGGDNKTTSNSISKAKKPTKPEVPSITTSNASETKSIDLPSSFSKYFSGILGEKNNIQMRITRKDSSLSGFYLYEKIGMGIPFLGKIDDQGNVEITEYTYVTDYEGKINPGDKTGIFKGKLAGKKIEGTWSSPKGDKTLPFSITLQEPTKEKFTGSWNITDKKSGFTLELIQDGNQVKGGACAVIDDGRRIDCGSDDIKNEPNVEGTITDNVATVTFQSSFDTESKGTAVIILTDKGLIWDVTQEPKGESYIFTHCLMKKKK
jgi:hypothetical protein